MNKIKELTAEQVEVFYSLEGESMVGEPTLYIRFSRCNLKCPKFNNPNLEPTLEFNPKDYTDIKDIPIITKGCDSQYAWNRDFAHMWKVQTAEEMLDDCLAAIPWGDWVHPETGLDVILSLTGGEPTLRQPFIMELLNHPKAKTLKRVLFETNASVPLKDEFIEALNNWTEAENGRKVIWSCSPKLEYQSGEKAKKAIRPEVVHKQLGVDGCRQYFKFVCDASDAAFIEVRNVMKQFDVPTKSPEVWIMAVACTKEQQEEIQVHVAEKCMRAGFRYTPRLQNILWGNAIGT